MRKIMEIKITVLGEPKPQPRHRHYRRGTFIGIYDPAAEDKKSFLQLVLEQAPEKPFNEPLCVDITFYFSRPKSHYGTGKNKNKLKLSAPKYHIVTPDRDNLEKFVADSMNKVFWRDDSIICDGCIRKLYSNMPRIEIEIKTLETEGSHEKNSMHRCSRNRQNNISI